MPDRPDQLSRGDLESMSPEEIEKARLDGKLDDLLGIKPRPHSGYVRRVGNHVVWSANPPPGTRKE